MFHVRELDTWWLVGCEGVYTVCRDLLMKNTGQNKHDYVKCTCVNVILLRPPSLGYYFLFLISTFFKLCMVGKELIRKHFTKVYTFCILLM